jgi:hypothetical protein
LGINRPILALVDPHDVAADLIRSARAGYVVEENTSEGVLKTLTSLISAWRQDTLPVRDWSVVKSHHRRQQVLKMDQLIEDLVKN